MIQSLLQLLLQM